MNIKHLKLGAGTLLLSLCSLSSLGCDAELERTPRQNNAPGSNHNTPDQGGQPDMALPPIDGA